MIRETERKSVPAAGLALLVFAAATAGCYDPKELQAFLEKPRQSGPGSGYRILPPDMLLVRSRVVPEINDVRQQVRPDGKINLPLIGEVEVANKTPRQIEGQIAVMAREYYDYNEIDVNVQVIGFNSQKFYVFGRVNRPGPMPWTGHDTLLDALAQAQVDFMAWPERITVVRGSSPIEGGQADREGSLKYRLVGVHPERKDSPPKKITINLWAMVKSGDMSNNILLEPNDVIYVRPNPYAEVGLAFQTLLLPIRPAIDTVRTPVAAVNSVGG